MEINEKTPREKAMDRLHDLLSLQKEVSGRFGENNYNVFVFGSYPTVEYDENKSDIDIAVYTPDFDLYKRLSCYLEEYYNTQNIRSDIFYIDPSIEAPVYCAPLNAKVQFTNYYPDQLVDLRDRCEQRLNELKEMVAL